METETVDLERVRHDAVLVIIRLGLGRYELKGPGRNVLEPESRVAWATVANELRGEGYEMVSPAEFADSFAMSEEEVLALVWREGSLFALAYGDEAGSGAGLLVPLPEKGVVFPAIDGN